jgi:hypothetical protein
MSGSTDRGRRILTENVPSGLTLMQRHLGVFQEERKDREEHNTCENSEWVQGRYSHNWPLYIKGKSLDFTQCLALDQ